MRTSRTSALITLALAAGLTATVTASGVSAEETPGLRAAGLTSGGTKITTFTTGVGVAEKSSKLTGLTLDSSLVGIDYRPQNTLLYGVGDQGGLYTVDPETGTASFVDRLDVPLEGTSFGVDFNPAANALRVVSNTGQNLRQRFADLALPTIEDGDLNYGGVAGANNAAGGGTSTGGTLATGVAGAAYTNNDADGAPAPMGQPANGNTGTVLYDIDTTKDVLATQNANPGILTAVGSGLGVDASDVAGFDIYSELAGGKAITNDAFAILTVAGERGLYSINLTSGTATFLRDVTRGVSDIAIAYTQA